MSQYVTAEYYRNTFKGTLLTDDEVDKYLTLASEKIDEVTFNRIVKIGFNNLTTFQKECVEKSVCYQAEYYRTNGVYRNSLSSYSVLDISVSIDEKSKTKADDLNMDEFAYRHILKSGLATRSLIAWL